MDFLTAILLGDDPLTQHPPTPQHPKTPPTSPTTLLNTVPDGLNLLGVYPNTPPNNHQQITNNPQQLESVGDLLGVVGGLLGHTPNNLSLSETANTSIVGDVGGVLGVGGVDPQHSQHLEPDPLSDAGWSAVWRERIQTHLQTLEDWVWRDEYELMRTANNGLPKARGQAREKLARWYFFMLEQQRTVNA